MPKHTLKLLALVIFAVAPANAGHRVGPPGASRHDGPACPYERAKLAAAAAKAAHTAKAETRVTLGGGASSGRWLFGLRDTPRDLTP